MSEWIIDQCLPRTALGSHHAIWLPHRPAEVERALFAVTPSDAPTFRRLMGLRLALHRLAGRDVPIHLDTPVFDQLANEGFAMLGHEPKRQVAFGAVGQFWRLIENLPRRGLNPESFVGFDEADHAKAAIDFRFIEQTEGTLLRTETRIAGTTPEAERQFRAYWWLIRPGSDVVRRSLFRGVRRRLERASGE